MLTTTSKQVQQDEDEIKEEEIKERKKGFIKNQPSFKHYKHSSWKRCAKATHSSYVSADVQGWEHVPVTGSPRRRQQDAGGRSEPARQTCGATLSKQSPWRRSAPADR